jgi:hypothetical protein
MNADERKSRKDERPSDYTRSFALICGLSRYACGSM